MSLLVAIPGVTFPDYRHWRAFETLAAGTKYTRRRRMPAARSRGFGLEIDVSSSTSIGTIIRCSSGVRYLNSADGYGQGIEGSVEGVYVPLGWPEAYSDLKTAWNNKGPEGLLNADEDVWARLRVAVDRHFREELVIDVERCEEAFYGWVPVEIRPDTALWFINYLPRAAGFLVWGGREM